MFHSPQFRWQNQGKYIYRLNKSVTIYTIVHYSMQNNRQQPQKLNKEKERERDKDKIVEKFRIR